MYSAAATACIFRIGQGEKIVKESEKDVDNRRCSYGADALHSKGSCADSEMQCDQSIWSEGEAVEEFLRKYEGYDVSDPNNIVPLETGVAE